MGATSLCARFVRGCSLNAYIASVLDGVTCRRTSTGYTFRMRDALSARHAWSARRIDPRTPGGLWRRMSTIRVSCCCSVPTGHRLGEPVTGDEPCTGEPSIQRGRNGDRLGQPVTGRDRRRQLGHRPTRRKGDRLGEPVTAVESLIASQLMQLPPAWRAGDRSPTPKTPQSSSSPRPQW